MAARNKLLVNYVYIYLNNLKPERWMWRDFVFDFQPFYVGRGINDRIDDHLKTNTRADGSHKSNTINAIINEGGEDPIRYKLYVDLNYDESLDIEAEIISFFGRRNNKTGILCNLTDGGDGAKGWFAKKETREKMSRARKTSPDNGGVKMNQKDLSGNLIKEWPSLKSIGREFNLPDSILCFISKECKEKGYLQYLDFIWEIAPKLPAKIKNVKSLKVYQYSLAGDFIQTFDSARDAERFIGTSGGISFAAARGKPLLNFQWFRDYQGERVESAYSFSPMNRRVIQLDKNGVVIKIHESAKSAVIELGLRSIYGALNKGSFSFGYFWEWESEFKEISTKTVYSRDKAIYQYFEGKFVAKFDSRKEAGEKTGISPGCICEAARKNNRISGGFQWFSSFQGETCDLPKPQNRSNLRSVNCYDEQMNLVKQFRSITDAEKFVGIGLYSALKISSRKTGGYYWRYATTV